MDINFLDVLLHIANIVILYVLLRFILYKPIQKFMKARSERIQNQMDDAENAKRAIMEEKELYNKRISEIEEDKRQILRECQKTAKEKAERNDMKNEICTSVFKNGILTKEDYTKIWIELISVLEHNKSVNFSTSQ